MTQPGTEHNHVEGRMALIRKIEAICATPKDALNVEFTGIVLIVLTALIENGGALSVNGTAADARERPGGPPRVVLRLHGLEVSGQNMEEAISSWLEAARDNLDRRVVT
ncbi:hypothetical protein [Ruegeria atlantica]|uniref:hypothetical protein n=1 Tax=Ruegeria atlantica TaxID=81569 RepID=UPI0014814C7F|nr:hypothetical protein [Ruegeria atlantica]